MSPQEPIDASWSLYVGWKDGSEGKVLIVQAWEFEFSPQMDIKGAMCGGVTSYFKIGHKETGKSLGLT